MIRRFARIAFWMLAFYVLGLLTTVVDAANC